MPRQPPSPYHSLTGTAGLGKPRGRESSGAFFSGSLRKQINELLRERREMRLLPEDRRENRMGMWAYLGLGPYFGGAKTLRLARSQVCRRKEGR